MDCFYIFFSFSGNGVEHTTLFRKWENRVEIVFPFLVQFPYVTIILFYFLFLDLKSQHSFLSTITWVTNLVGTVSLVDTVMQVVKDVFEVRFSLKKVFFFLYINQLHRFSLHFTLLYLCMHKHPLFRKSELGGIFFV